MQIFSSPDRWGSVTRSLHWLTAAFILATAAVGLVMEQIDRLPVYMLHKSLGLTVLALVLLRLAWRMIDRRPPYPPGMPGWQRIASSTAHALIYVAMLVMPLSGWLYNSAARRPLDWFGLFKVPSLTHHDRASSEFSILGLPAPEFIDTPQKLRALAGDLHEYLFYAGAALLLLHVGAALKHHFFDRDPTLARMLPGLQPPAASANKE